MWYKDEWFVLFVLPKYIFLNDDKRKKENKNKILKMKNMWKIKITNNQNFEEKNEKKSDIEESKIFEEAK